MIRILTLLLLLSTSSYAAKKAIYGLDDRILLSQVANRTYQTWGESVGAVIPIRDLNYQREQKQYRIKAARVFGQEFLCPEVRFSQFKRFGHCTGFLVGEDRFVTSAHCIKSEKQCRDMSFAFTYKQGRLSSSDYIGEESVYFCKKIINRVKNRLSGNDFALIELDRKVKNRSPLSYRKTGRVDSCDEMVVIGHGSGLPLLIAENGLIRANESDFVFNTTLDVFVGNSGSPVFNNRTGLVEGIISEGEEDLVFDKSRNCYVNRVCSETKNDCQGESAVRITVIPELAPGMTPQEPTVDPDNPFAVF